MSRWKVRHVSGLALAMLAMLEGATAATAQTTSAEQVSAAVPAKGAPKNPIPRRPLSPSPGTAAQAKSRNEVDAAAAQNPISNMISTPFQKNANFSAGPYRRPQNVVLVEPVVPFHLNEDWSRVTRWIAPVCPAYSRRRVASSGSGRCSRNSTSSRRTTTCKDWPA